MLFNIALIWKNKLINNPFYIVILHFYKKNTYKYLPINIEKILFF